MKKENRAGYCKDCIHHKPHYFKNYGYCVLGGKTVDSEKPICNVSYNKDNFDEN